MTNKVTADTAQTQLDQIIDRAVKRNERFLVERNGEPSVLILSVADFIQTLAPPPDWMNDIQDEARSKGLDKLSMSEIEAEISAARRERRR